MNHRRASSSLGWFLLLVLLPLYASAAPKDPCKLLQRDLDQQIDDLKAWQKLDLQECYRVSGSASDACRELKDQHALDLQRFRDNRAYQMANCRGYRTRGVAAVPSLASNNNDFYDNYYSNRGKCVQYPYVDCSQYDRYIHYKLHHYPHHNYSEPTYGGAKSAYAGKPSKNEAQEYADKGAKRNVAATRSSVAGSPAESAHRSSDRDASSNHGSGHGDSSPKTASSHNHDNGGASNSGGSHASSAASHASESSSSAGSSSSGAHSSGGNGSSSSGSPSSSGAGHSGSASSGNSAASATSSAASPASSPSHDSGGSHPH